MQLDEIVTMLRNIGNKLQLLHVFTITDVHRMPFDMAVLKAIISSFKMREDSDADGEQRMLRMKALGPLLPTDVPLHHNARRERGGNPLYLGKRIVVSDKQVPWSFAWPDYNPSDFTAQVVIDNSALLSTGNKWADPAELQGSAVKPGFESLLAEVRERTTYTGGPRGEKLRRSLATAISFDAAGVPLNPHGRTGLRGRGLLGKWGPNHAADPIVTRYLGSQLQMVAIKRNDTGDWAIPGGMVDEGETVSVTLKREFTEEAGGHMEQSSKARFNELTTELFKHGDLVYRGCECQSFEPGTRPADWLIPCLPLLGQMSTTRAILTTHGWRRLRTTSTAAMSWVRCCSSGRETTRGKSRGSTSTQRQSIGMGRLPCPFAAAATRDLPCTMNCAPLRCLCKNAACAAPLHYLTLSPTPSGTATSTQTTASGWRRSQRR